MFVEYSLNIFRKYSLDITAANIRITVAMFREYSRNISRKYSLDITPANIREYSVLAGYTKRRQQKFRAMNGAHLASPIRGELGYAHWPQLGTQFIALLGTKFGAH